MSNQTANKNNINFLLCKSNHDSQKRARDPQTLTVHTAHTAISTTRSHHGSMWYLSMYVHVHTMTFCIA